MIKIMPTATNNRSREGDLSIAMLADCGVLLYFAILLLYSLPMHKKREGKAQEWLKMAAAKAASHE